MEKGLVEVNKLASIFTSILRRFTNGGGHYHFFKSGNSFNEIVEIPHPFSSSFPESINLGSFKKQINPQKSVGFKKSTSILNYQLPNTS